MENNKMRNDIVLIRDMIQDEESLMLFDARCAFNLDRDDEKFWSKIKGLNKNFTIYNDAIEVVKDANVAGREIVVYGCGQYGLITYIALDSCGIKVSFFCDSNELLTGEFKCGAEVISMTQLVENHKEALVIVATKNYNEEIKDKLLKAGFLEDNIIIPQNGRFMSYCGNQYFDFFEPNRKEVFIDAGAYDGETTKGFIKWAGKDFEAAYLLEPLLKMKPILNEKFSEYANIHIDYKAAWDKEEILYFGGEDMAFGLGRGDGIEKVNASRIDEIVKDERVTFIKMDIEGSEERALIGALDTIKKNRPKLAICIYHKPEDIITIPKLLKEIVPEYKLAIRQYCSFTEETVLYAWV